MFRVESFDPDPARPTFRARLVDTALYVTVRPQHALDGMDALLVAVLTPPLTTRIMAAVLTAGTDAELRHADLLRVYGEWFRQPDHLGYEPPMALVPLYRMSLWPPPDIVNEATVGGGDGGVFDALPLRVPDFLHRLPPPDRHGEPSQLLYCSVLPASTPDGAGYIYPRALCAPGRIVPAQIALREIDTAETERVPALTMYSHPVGKFRDLPYIVGASPGTLKGPKRTPHERRRIARLGAPQFAVWDEKNRTIAALQRQAALLEERERQGRDLTPEQKDRRRLADLYRILQTEGDRAGPDWVEYASWEIRGIERRLGLRAPLADGETDVEPKGTQIQRAQFHGTIAPLQEVPYLPPAAPAREEPAQIP